jgi:hypothetical protein
MGDADLFVVAGVAGVASAIEREVPQRAAPNQPAAPRPGPAAEPPPPQDLMNSVSASRGLRLCIHN